MRLLAPILAVLFLGTCLGSTIDLGTQNQRLFFSRLPARHNIPIPKLSADWIMEQRKLAEKEAAKRSELWHFRLSSMVLLALIGITGPTLIYKARRRFQEAAAFPGTKEFFRLRSQESIYVTRTWAYKRPWSERMMLSWIFGFLDWGSGRKATSRPECIEAAQPIRTPLLERILTSKLAGYLDRVPDSLMPGC
jgi:hypothetical protein